MWQVYILECLDGSLYTGTTTDVKRRFLMHKTGKGAKYTRSHPVKRIVFTAEFQTRSEALKYELEIKKLTKIEKLQLIAQGKSEETFI